MTRTLGHYVFGMSPTPDSPRKRTPVSGRILTWWFGLMSVAGMAFGAYADKHPFGNDILEHPVVILFVVVGAALLALRFALRRPIPEIIPDRLLLAGCLVGLAAFLIGNWLAVNLRTL
jgi:peptidoglycan/LPS O-acetylase OafA/YrhL